MVTVADVSASDASGVMVLHSALTTALMTTGRLERSRYTLKRNSITSPSRAT